MFPYYLFLLSLCYFPLTILVGFDLGGRGAFLASVLFFLISYKDPLLKKVTKNKMNVIFGLLILYHFINALIKGAPVGSVFTSFISMFNLYAMLIMAGYLYLKNEKKAIRFFLIGYALFIVLGFATGISMGNEGRLANEGDYVSHININQFVPVVGLFLLFLVYNKFHSQKRLVRTIIIAIAPMIVLVMSGSRNGILFLLAFMIALVFGGLAGRKLTFGQILLAVIGIGVMWFGYDYIINNTVVGERIITTSEQAEMFNMETGVWFLDVLGDRGIFYLIGWQDFLSHPISGIGYMNFSTLHSNDLRFALHSEYLIHLVEGGLIAFVLFLSFYYGVIKNLILIWKKRHAATIFVLLCSVVLYLVVGLTAREFMYVQFYPMIACLVLKKRYNKK